MFGADDVSVGADGDIHARLVQTGGQISNKERGFSHRAASDVWVPLDRYGQRRVINIFKPGLTKCKERRILRGVKDKELVKQAQRAVA